MAWAPDGDNIADRIPLSALEHYAYCPRQAGLIHLDGVFTDDANTTRGQLAHQRVDRPGVKATATPGTRHHYAVPVWSTSLGVYGRCDVVEIGVTTAIPIEHKIGSYQAGGPADVQVAAQALCLREMLDLDIPHGIVFTHADRRRHTVPLTNALITTVHTVTAQLRHLLNQAQLPAPLADSRCRRCSLLDDCLPYALTTPPPDLFQPHTLGTWHD